MEKDLTPHESLSIIRSMIDKTKHSISDSSHYFLLWGYAVFLGCSIQFALIKAGYEKHYMAWWITVAALVVHILLGIRDSKKEKVSTYVGEANGYLWMGIGFGFMVLAFIFSKLGWQYCFPFYILFYGLGTFVSGNMLRFKPLITGGAVCYVLAIIATFVEYDIQILLTAVSILISYIVPGHLLRMQYHKQKQLS
jgi:hypothetical protein